MDLDHNLLILFSTFTTKNNLNVIFGLLSINLRNTDMSQMNVSWMKKIYTLTFLILFCNYNCSAQSNGIYLRVNQNNFTDFHFFFVDGDTLGIEIRKSRRIHSVEIGINKQLHILKNLSIVGGFGIKKFQRPMSSRHRLPNNSEIFNNIKLKVIFLSPSVALQYRFKKFAIKLGYNAEIGISRKLTADGGEYNFKGQDWANGFYKQVNMFFTQLNFSLTDRLSIFGTAAIHLERQTSIYFISVADFIHKQSQFSLGVQYDLW